MSEWPYPEISLQYKSLRSEAVEGCIVEVFYVPGRKGRSDNRGGFLGLITLGGIRESGSSGI